MTALALIGAGIALLVASGVLFELRALRRDVAVVTYALHNVARVTFRLVTGRGIDE